MTACEQYNVEYAIDVGVMLLTYSNADDTQSSYTIGNSVFNFTVFFLNICKRAKFNWTDRLDILFFSRGIGFSVRIEKIKVESHKKERFG